MSQGIDIEALIGAFRDKAASHAGYELLPRLLSGPPKDIEAFVERVLERLPRGGTFFDAALSHVSETTLRRLIDERLHCLSNGGELDDVTESLISYASLQCPDSLSPHLATILRVRPNKGTYGEDWPWRSAGLVEVEMLSERLAAETSPDERKKLVGCLLETRRPEAVEIARSEIGSMQTGMALSGWLAEVGLSTDVEPLYQSEGFHLIFPPGYFPAPRQSWSLSGLHPTWRFPTEGPAYRFGGDGSASCGLCGGTLHHLVSLPSDLVFVGTEKSGLVPLEACLSCLGWEEPVLFYHHGQEGISSLNEGTVEPQFPVGPLAECAVHIVRTPSRWCWQDWGHSNSRENLHRISGYPCWIQSADYPACPSCKRTMQFILQLDSDLQMADGNEWLWGSGGIGYGFSCSGCRTSAFSWQCT